MEKVYTLIQNSNEFGITQKISTIATIKRLVTKDTERKNLLEKIYNSFSTIEKGRVTINEYTVLNQYVIVNVTDRSVGEEDYFHNTFRTYNTKSNRLLSECSKTLEQQILVTLGWEYCGVNSDFAKLVSKMLGINSKE